MKLVTVYDTKAQAHLGVHVARTTAEALRQFESSCKSPDSNFYKFPSDFILFELGEFDEVTGKLTPYDDKRSIATSAEFSH